MKVKEVHQSIQKFIIDNALPITLERRPKFPSVSSSVEKGQPLDKKNIIGFGMWTISLYTYPSETNINITLYSNYKGDSREDNVLYYSLPTIPEGTEGQEHISKIVTLLETLLGKPTNVNNRPLIFTLYPEKKFVIAKVKKEKETGEFRVTELGRVDSKEFKTLDQYHYDFEKGLAYKKEGYLYETESK
jgi:hypothetical protein